MQIFLEKKLAKKSHYIQVHYAIVLLLYSESLAVNKEAATEQLCRRISLHDALLHGIISVLSANHFTICPPTCCSANRSITSLMEIQCQLA